MTATLSIIAGDVVIEAVGGGTDTVFASCETTPFAVGQEIENLWTNNVAGCGARSTSLATYLAKDIRGNNGNNGLNGGVGADTMRGFAGNDSTLSIMLAMLSLKLLAAGRDTVVRFGELHACGWPGDRETCGTYQRCGCGGAQPHWQQSCQRHSRQQRQQRPQWWWLEPTPCGVLLAMTATLSIMLAMLSLKLLAAGRDTVFASVSYTLAVGQEIENCGLPTLRVWGRSTSLATILPTTFAATTATTASMVVLEADTMRGFAGYDSYIVVIMLAMLSLKLLAAGRTRCSLR